MIILGLGSNIGDRLLYLESALAHLNNTALKISAISPIYETDALLKEGAPAEWDIKFLNMTVAGESELSPQELLFEIKAIEKKVGRKDRGVWAPREIDIDILVYGNQQIVEENLTVPHAELLNRAFALLPLADIAPDLLLNGKTVLEIVSTFPPDSTRKTNLQVRLR